MKHAMNDEPDNEPDDEPDDEQAMIAPTMVR